MNFGRIYDSEIQAEETLRTARGRVALGESRRGVESRATLGVLHAAGRLFLRILSHPRAFQTRSAARSRGAPGDVSIGGRAVALESSKRGHGGGGAALPALINTLSEMWGIFCYRVVCCVLTTARY